MKKDDVWSPLQSRDARSCVSTDGAVLVVGLGNPILGDDGVGWKVAELVQEQFSTRHDPNPNARVDFECLALGGLSLMENLIGYQQVIIIDAITTQQQPLGTVSHFRLKDLPDFAAGHMTSAHDTSLQNAIKVGNAMGVSLPEEVEIVAIEAQFVHDFSEQMSNEIKAAIPEAAEIVHQILNNWLHSR